MNTETHAIVRQPAGSYGVVRLIKIEGVTYAMPLNLSDRPYHTAFRSKAKARAAAIAQAGDRRRVVPGLLVRDFLKPQIDAVKPDMVTP